MCRCFVRLKSLPKSAPWVLMALTIVDSRGRGLVRMGWVKGTFKEDVVDQDEHG